MLQPHSPVAVEDGAGNEAVGDEEDDGAREIVLTAMSWRGRGRRLREAGAAAPMILPFTTGTSR
jgi:hypothetical protein